jgi:hypothetical protein
MLTVAYRDLNTNNVNVNATNLSYVKGVIILFIVLDSLLILYSIYQLVKIRSSNGGGFFMALLGLIVIILFMVFGIIALNKIGDLQFQWVIKSLAFTIIFGSASVILLFLSSWTRPRLAIYSQSKNIVEKIKTNVDNMRPAAPNGDYVEVNDAFIPRSELANARNTALPSSSAVRTTTTRTVSASPSRNIVIEG